MTVNRANIREALHSFDFKQLFVDELGWDHHHLQPLLVSVDSLPYRLDAIAEKRGMVAFLCHPGNESTPAPPYAIRRRIENQVRRAAHEHLIIYLDAAAEVQIWQWVRREPGRPAACREHYYHKGQPGDALIQKLEAISFSLDEEEALSVTVVAGRARRAFDVETVTKRFYDRFKSEQQAFLAFIKGVQGAGDRAWYASLMLNRLMFVYFIQKKGFLDGDPDYLRHRLRTTQITKGKDKFHSFYRYFLLRLFHEGLGGPARTSELEALLGEVPYLNGGLFDIHQLERSNDSIEIADEAFEGIFEFFDSYSWTLDSRPLRADNEINPDVLGYIFEKYINQKQMGAYYTKEDITGYITRATIIPFALESARTRCGDAFEGADGATVWDLLRAEPDRYIYGAVRHGVALALPSEISAGIKTPTLDKSTDLVPTRTLEVRTPWNRRASSEWGLPTETWREVVSRRARHDSLRHQLEEGALRTTADLVASNIDLSQFAQDAIESSETPEVLRAFWHAVEEITILDPTCGSGAFLFAALNVLEPLYEACLDRMEAFLSEAPPSRKKGGEAFEEFHDVLGRVASHPNRRFFIFKSIVLNNLFGVDIMEEAVEICKLRLFLKLASCIEPDTTRVNLGIEPLPDIDFNIKAGNTLVGFATYGEAQEAITSQFDFGGTMKRISDSAAVLQQAFDDFRALQVQAGGNVPTSSKSDLQKELADLRDELDRWLATEYGTDELKRFEAWRAAYQPFHWFVEFYGIMASGGFDVIIGNPPYLDLQQLTTYQPRNYQTLATKNLCSLVLERCDSLSKGRQGFIVPIATTATEGYLALQRVLIRRDMWFVSFDDRPAHLFEGLDKNTLSIVLLSEVRDEPLLYSSRLNRWNSEERPFLFQLVHLHRTPCCLLPGCLPRIGGELESVIWEKVFCRPERLASAYSGVGGGQTYYSRKVNAFLQILDFVPLVRDGRGMLRAPSEFKTLTFADAEQAAAVLCLLNSSLFRWFIDVVSDGSHLNRREIDNFPFDPRDIVDHSLFVLLAKRLSKDLKGHSFERTMAYRHDTLTVQCIVPKHSLPIINEVDRLLARHYGLTEAELDFIMNYDIKYRLGSLEEMAV